MDADIAAGARRIKIRAQLPGSASILQCWKKGANVHPDRRPFVCCAEPVNDLRLVEHAVVSKVSNAVEFVSSLESRIVPKPADQGRNFALFRCFDRNLRLATYARTGLFPRFRRSRTTGRMTQLTEQESREVTRA